MKIRPLPASLATALLVLSPGAFAGARQDAQVVMATDPA